MSLIARAARIGMGGGLNPKPIDLPGVSELSLMCGNARRVASLCDGLGLGGSDAPEAPGDFLDFLGQAQEAIQDVPDGAFILPPE